jgi:hypothetical protein
MPTTATRITGTAVNVDRAGNTAWATPSNATNDNATTTDAAVPTDYLVCTNFGFAVPAGAVIVGVTCNVECHETGTGSSNYTAQLITDATPTLIGASQTSGTVNGTTPTVYAVGSASNLWSATLTPAAVNSSTFGVAVWSTDTTNTLLVDYVALIIEYRSGLAVAGVG